MASLWLTVFPQTWFGHVGSHTDRRCLGAPVPVRIHTDSQRPRTQETGELLLATHNGPALLSSPPEAASALVSCGQREGCGLREGMGDSEGRGGFEGALYACLPSLLVLEADMGALLGDHIFKAHIETDGLPEEVFPI